MKIGFDLDKIFIDYPPFFPSILFDIFYKQKDNGTLLYRIPSYPEQLGRKLLHLPFMRPPITENLQLLKKLHNKKNKLYLISSRYHFLKKETAQIVKKHQLDSIFTNLYFNFENKQPHIFKNEVLQKLQLDYYIDDDLSLLTYVAKRNPKTTFFWLNYRKQHKKTAKNIIPITTLSEIFDTIK